MMQKSFINQRYDLMKTYENGVLKMWRSTLNSVNDSNDLIVAIGWWLGLSDFEISLPEEFCTKPNNKSEATNLTVFVYYQDKVEAQYLSLYWYAQYFNIWLICDYDDRSKFLCRYVHTFFFFFKSTYHTDLLASNDTLNAWLDWHKPGDKLIQPEDCCWFKFFSCQKSFSAFSLADQTILCCVYYNGTLQ